MATIDVVREHGLGLEGGRQAVQAVAERLRGDLNARYTWSGDMLKFACTGADGRIDVTGDKVRIAVDLSWLLKPARGRIEQSINDYLDQYLA